MKTHCISGLGNSKVSTDTIETWILFSIDLDQCYSVFDLLANSHLVMSLSCLSAYRCGVMRAAQSHILDQLFARHARHTRHCKTISFREQIFFASKTEEFS